MVGSRNNSLKSAVLREDLGAAVQIAAELSISAVMRTLSDAAQRSAHLARSIDRARDA